MMTTTSNTEQRSSVSCKRVARWVKGGNTANSRALSHNSFNAVKKLDEMRLLLNKALDLDLRAKKLFERNALEKNVKQFCGELLDRCVPNHWKTTLRSKHTPRKTRITVASSLFSLRKLLPNDKPCPDEYARRMSRLQPSLDEHFSSFCKAEVERMFPSGWDKGYWSKVEVFTPPSKSNRDKKEEGTYRKQAVENHSLRGEFRRWAGGTVVSPLDREVQARAVLTGGKWRVITLSELQLANLLPLHRTIYDFISRKEWLLRGEAEPSMFKMFYKKDGEVFVSGDYEGATDNLNINCSKLVLGTLLSSATHIPLRVREEAEASLEMTFRVGKEKLLQRRGQLMGSPLSFPLLCLTNYLTFKYAVPREGVPVKINGDDIIFRCSPEERNRWFELVSKSGLVVSKGKTLVSSTFFSLNSTYFLATSGAPLRPSLFRATCLLTRCDDMVEFAGRCARVKKDLVRRCEVIDALEVLVRRNLRHCIYPSNGSLGRRYDCSLPRGLLVRVRLEERESFYRSLASEDPVMGRNDERQCCIPAEWKQREYGFSDEVEVPESEVVKTFVDGAWTVPFTPPKPDKYWEELRRHAPRFVAFSPRAVKLFLKCGGKRGELFTRFPSWKKKEKKWYKKNEEMSWAPFKPVSVAFTSGGVWQKSPFEERFGSGGVFRV